ncbi:MAG TPA: Crp/Fnr family transcriptional regulator [Streptosporangiaceae bacterium]|nr:Crp/Fnr family transcriptional regulator [Streptosporangiaceae bacterium]
MGGTGFWHLLTEAERGVLTEHGRNVAFKQGAAICTQGEPATHLFVLTSGWVKVTGSTRDGREHVLAVRGSGDVVGELAAEAAGLRTATMWAISMVGALIVPHTAFSDFLDGTPGANRAYRQALTQRWGQAASLLLARSGTTGGQRLAWTLLDLAGQHGVRADDVVRIQIPLSQDELASLAGVSRATATRALARWRRRGLIRTARRSIVISDPDELRQIATP